MNNTECRDHGCHCECHTNCHISWGGIIAGALVAVGLSFLFHLLMMGIGLSSVTKTDKGMEVLVLSVLIWSLIGSFVIFFLSGSIAGRVAGAHCERTCTGMVYGFLVWCVAMLISMTMMTQMTETTGSLVRSGPVINIVAETSSDNTASVERRENRRNQAEIREEVKELAHQTGIASLSTFILFSIGALGGALGGCHGVRRCRKEKEAKV